MNEQQQDRIMTMFERAIAVFAGAWTGYLVWLLWLR